jgi:hypothetical protein
MTQPTLKVTTILSATLVLPMLQVNLRKQNPKLNLRICLQQAQKIRLVGLFSKDQTFDSASKRLGFWLKKI